jgi:hypothetical protein
MTPKQKNLAVFHIMCAIPEDGFTESANHYGKKIKPEISMYMREFAASGGVPNWMENPAAVDPMERTEEDVNEDLPEVDGDDGEVVRATSKVVAATGPKLPTKIAAAAK